MWEIKTNEQCGYLRAFAVIDMGKRVEHPSGATCYRHERFGTVVGTWTDKVFNVLRYYK